jgi:hypothetical protein
MCSTYSFGLATLGGFDIDLDNITVDLSTVDLGSHLKLETLL